jgi:hypothetical protein
MTSSHGPKFERRSEPRTRLSAGCVCWLFAPPDFRRRQATVLDVACGGLGLLLAEPLRVGAMVAIRPDGPIDPNQVLGMRVRHATPQPDGSWLVGCSRARDLSDDVLRALLEALRPVDDYGLVGGR